MLIHYIKKIIIHLHNSGILSHIEYEELFQQVSFLLFTIVVDFIVFLILLWITFCIVDKVHEIRLLKTGKWYKDSDGQLKKIKWGNKE